MEIHYLYPCFLIDDFNLCMQFSRPLEGMARSPMAALEPKTENFVEWDTWARHQLMSTGSDLFGKFTNIQVRPDTF